MRMISFSFLLIVASCCAALSAGRETSKTNAIGGNENKRSELPHPARDTDPSLAASIRILNSQKRGFEVRLKTVEAFASAGLDEVSKHVLPLTTSIGIPRSQKYLDILSENVEQPNGSVAVAPIKNIKDEIFMAPIIVGGQNFYAAIDSGSSDTWLMMKGYNCIMPPWYIEGLNKAAGIPSCQFGPSYTKSSTFSQIADQHFNTTYSDGDYATGILGKDDVIIGNITLKGQTLGFVDTLKWHGDGVSSGNMGLGFPSITNAWNGTDFRKDRKGNNIQYAPIFTNLYRQKIIQPYFSIALNRATEGPGMLAFGGVPGDPIRHTGNFVRVPMQQLAITANRPKPKSEDGFVDYTFYVGNVDKFLANSVPLSPEPGPMPVIVDSGSRFCHLPKRIVDGMMEQWKPKPFLNKVGQWQVTCDSTPPAFELAFNGSRIVINKEDLILNIFGTCVSTVTYSPGGDEKAGGQWVLGAPFFRSVVAVFDVGAAEMRFANRVR